jgi:hypothetical protein
MGRMVALAVALVALRVRAEKLEGVAGAVSAPGFQLARTLNDQERAYFGKVLAHVARATNTGCPPTNWGVGEPRSLEQPATLTSTEGILLRGGAFPVRDEHLTLQCADARDHQISVHYSPEPIDLHPKSAKKILESSVDRVLYIHHYGVAALAVNAPVPVRENVSPQRLSPIMGIEILFFANDDLQRSIAEARAADAAAMRAALSAALPAPAAPADCGVPSVGPTASSETDEVAVFAAVVRHHLQREPKGQVVVEESDTLELNDRAIAAAKETAPCLRADALQDFAARAKQSKPLPKGALIEAGFLVPTDEERGKFFQRGGGYWKPFEAAFPQSKGILRFSQVGFSKNRTQAIVYVGWTAGLVLGSGEVFVLQRSGAEWRVLYVSHLWEA